MSDGPKCIAFVDLEGKIPAKDGDLVALLKTTGPGQEWCFFNPDPNTRPTFRDGVVRLDGTEKLCRSDTGED